MSDYQFSHMTDLELVQMQKEVRDAGFPEDEEFLNAIMEELKNRFSNKIYCKINFKKSKKPGYLGDINGPGCDPGVV